MKLFLAALTIWSLPLLGISCGPAGVQEPETAKPAVTPASSPTPSGETVTLTPEHSTGSFLLQPVLFKKLPPILEVSVTKVVNPAAKPVTIFVFLSPRNGKNDAASNRIEVGNFSLYPADRPAKFMLDASALRTVSEGRNVPAVKEWQLVFELEKKEAASSLEVTIASPNWKSDKN
jgi:hypothetical protein